MSKRVLLGVIVLLAAMPVLSPAPVSAAEVPPGSEKVKTVHKQLMNRYGVPIDSRYDGEKEMIDARPSDEMQARQREEPRSGGFGAWLKRWGLLVSVIIIVVLAIVIFLMFRWVPGVFRPTIRTGVDPQFRREKGGKRTVSTSPDQDYDIARDFARRGEFGPALVVLHKGSVKRLQEKRLIPRQDNLTNNDIRRLVAKTGSVLHGPFSQLATAAERAAFKNENPGESTFTTFKTLYERVFLRTGASGGAG